MACATPDVAGARHSGLSHVPDAMARADLSTRDIVDAMCMAIACLISYWIMTHVLVGLVSRDSDLLGGMWAAIATIFVFRETSLGTMSARAARLIATVVSFALCLAYLLVLPFTPLGLAVLLFLGTVV
jgi:hypothetical protein